MPATAEAQLPLKRVLFLAQSADGGGVHYHPIGDLNRDGLLEMTYNTGEWNNLSNPIRWEILRFSPFRRWRIVKADTAPPYRPPPGIYSGNFVPCAIGDADRDGLCEIWGYNWLYNADTVDASIICAYEQPSSSELPVILTWYTLNWIMGWAVLPLYLPGNLDSDSLEDIPAKPDWTNGVVFENRGDNWYVQIWQAPCLMTSRALTFGDYDLDGRTEFVGGVQSWSGRVMVWETTGHDQFQCVWQDSVHLPNGGVDCFTGRDVNQNGRPEFFMAFYRYIGLMDWMCYLFMWEAGGNNVYTRIFVDSVHEWITTPGERSMCADLDGDGIEEVVWTTGRMVRVYKALPGNRFEKVFEWYNDHNLQHTETVHINIADVDYNGYNDILAASCQKVSILEVEAIRVLSPNGWQVLQPGDTCWIRWQTFNPPRCDSVSLFLRTGEYHLDTIATGLAPNDTPYAWVVPNIRAVPCWVMAIAYGPGWQYDEQDTAMWIVGIGESGEGPATVSEARIAALPNPARGPVMVSYEVPVSGPVEVSVLDITGRRVATLASGPHEPGKYRVKWDRQVPSGIYFFRLECGGVRRVVKVVLTEEER